MKMTMAALAALMGGDLENAIVASTPGGIEVQEAAGQAQFVANETMPIKCNYGTNRGQLEAIGIVYGDQVDDLFVNVQLPDGWGKVATGHSMWSKLIDEKGRERASIFYKAAFYDRDAFVNISQRYHVSVVPVLGYENPEYRQGGYHCNALDGDDIIWTSDPIGPEPEYPGRGDDDRRETWMAWHKQKDELAKAGQGWLDEHYPDWRNPVAYWD